MKRFPLRIRKLQKILNIPDEAVVEVKIPEGEPRVCDGCNGVLVDEKGITVKKAHLTDYGLMCEKCLCGLEPVVTYSEGQSVFYEQWYQSGIAR
jgi:hypothetical protein